MIFIILIVIALYSGLMVWLLAKVGSTPANSVIKMISGKAKSSHIQERRSYEQTISAR